METFEAATILLINLCMIVFVELRYPWHWKTCCLLIGDRMKNAPVSGTMDHPLNGILSS